MRRSREGNGGLEPGDAAGPAAAARLGAAARPGAAARRDAAGLWVASIALAFVAVILGVAGCGSSAPTGPPSGPPASGPVSPTSATPAGPPIGAPSLSPPSSPNAPPGSPVAGSDLLALLPATLEGQPLARFIVSGADFVQLAADAGAAGVRDFLGRLGREPGDLTAAVGIDQSGLVEGDLAAIRVARTSGASVLSAFVAAERHAVVGGVSVAARAMGGKRVTIVAGRGDAAPAPVYVYARGDILFLVQSSNRVVAAAALAALP